jgi:hypothetical protein
MGKSKKNRETELHVEGKRLKELKRMEGKGGRKCL